MGTHGGNKKDPEWGLFMHSGEGGRDSGTYHLIILPPTATKQECLAIIRRKLDGEDVTPAE
jgi:hypothetical protein